MTTPMLLLLMSTRSWAAVCGLHATVIEADVPSVGIPRAGSKVMDGGEVDGSVVADMLQRESTVTVFNVSTVYTVPAVLKVTTIFLFLLTASARAYCKSVLNSLAIPSSRLRAIDSVKEGAARVTRIPRMAMLIISSMMVNPASRCITGSSKQRGFASTGHFFLVHLHRLDLHIGCSSWCIQYHWLDYQIQQLGQHS